MGVGDGEIQLIAREKDDLAYHEYKGEINNLNS